VDARRVKRSRRTVGSGRAFALIAALALSACAGLPSACGPGQQAMLQATLLFGRNIKGRPAVSEPEWRRFLAREITPRFPDGLTAFNADGQWRDPVRGVAVHEPSKVVLIVARDDTTVRDRLNAVAEAYKRRFAQRSVGIVTNPTCASF
jgi:hypothetical protein